MSRVCRWSDIVSVNTLRNTSILLLGALTLAACQSVAENPGETVGTKPQPFASTAKAQTAPIKVGYELSEALCSGCHAISADEISSNPSSPSFVAIANTHGLTLARLREWLRDSHNFPEQMEMEVGDQDVDLLAGYIITLRDEDYKPSIQ